MFDKYFLDENRNAVPCDLYTWSEQFEKMSKEGTKHVADEMVDGNRVSTVWLGLNHQYDEGKPPLIFETMVFKDNHSGQEIYCSRYSTWQEAEEGHRIAVEWVKQGCHESCEE